MIMISPSPFCCRYELPGIAALNFVLKHSLGGGGVASIRIDPQVIRGITLFFSVFTYYEGEIYCNGYFSFLHYRGRDMLKCLLTLS